MQIVEALQLINIHPSRSVLEVANDVESVLLQYGYKIQSSDYDRPWGAFHKVSNADSFARDFFDKEMSGDIDAKIMIVAPRMRLSWQFHYLRRELWRFITDGYYMKSFSNKPSWRKKSKHNSTLEIDTLERHRLIGGKQYTIVAEIWDSIHGQSSETDIVRLADDFNRQ